ncbi:hypothetical protein D5039_08830 [Verminephrobacter aporrectodeae subsp. tuberculatae]|uniref:Bacterial Ig-like domain-containing protein n=2 Tax=Verminephrobacter TaxID=364316 RepID=A0ABT3KSG6_9BURK|nr:hypothetical protein [Verminephrobacter aporrectodeae subsp. tuberculatae]
MVQDATGNDAASFDEQAVTNNTPATDDTPAVADNTPPVISTATVNGNRMVITYTEANSLDGTALAGDAGFTVRSPRGAAITVTGAVVDATAKTVTLTLSRAEEPCSSNTPSPHPTPWCRTRPATTRQASTTRPSPTTRLRQRTTRPP